MFVLEANNRVLGEQYDAFTDDILIADSAGPLELEPYGNRPAKQRRKHCRYVRDDIRAGLVEKRFLSRKKCIPVRLIDVSQIGASIGFAKKLQSGDRLDLALNFEDGQNFEFSCSIAYRRPGHDDMIYGLKFEKANRKYEEHLLKTGLKIKLNKILVGN